MRERGIEPMVTLHHYEQPLATVFNHRGWHDRAMIDLFMRFNKAAEAYKTEMQNDLAERRQN